MQTSSPHSSCCRNWTTVLTAVMILVFVSLSGCNVSFVGDFKNTPEGNYDFFFHELEQNYAYRNYRFENNRTLNQIQELERSNLLADPSWENLAIVLGRVVYSHIADPHTGWTLAPIPKSIEDKIFNIYQSNRGSQFDSTIPNFSQGQFSNASLTTTDFMKYTVFQSTSDNQKPIGYIYITKLDRSRSVESENQSLSSTIDSILRGFYDQGADRVIIDIRSSAGGSYYIAEIIASRFINRTVKYSEFAEPTSSDTFSKQSQYISPAGYGFFQNQPLVILVNTNTCSAGELLLLMLRQSGGANRVIGTPTLGCPGSVLHRELPNGWIFQLTVTRSYDENGGEYFRTGIKPKIEEVNQSSSYDRVLNLAIDVIRGL